MEDMFPVVDVETFRALELHQAEARFDEVKAQILGTSRKVTGLPRARTYLHAIEDILAERHEARRAEAKMPRDY